MSEEQEHPKLRIIRAMLAKAETTSFESEAESFREKAEQLMAQYSIDEALVSFQAESASKPDFFECSVQNPYSKQRGILLNVISGVFNCKTIAIKREGGERHYEVFGFQADLDMVWTLWESINLQMNNAVSQQPRSTSSFKISFMIGFITEVGERLEQIYKKEVMDSGGSSTELVLASRMDQVERLHDNRHPNVVKGRASKIQDLLGLASGMHSGRKADLFLPGSRFDRDPDSASELTASFRYYENYLIIYTDGSAEIKDDNWARMMREGTFTRQLADIGDGAFYLLGDEQEITVFHPISLEERELQGSYEMIQFKDGQNSESVTISSHDAGEILRLSENMNSDIWDLVGGHIMVVDGDKMTFSLRAEKSS